MDDKHIETSPPARPGQPAATQGAQRTARIVAMVVVVLGGGAFVVHEVTAKASGASSQASKEEDDDSMPLTFDHEAADSLGAKTGSAPPAAAVQDAGSEAAPRAQDAALLVAPPTSASAAPSAVGGETPGLGVPAASESEFQKQRDALRVAHLLKLEQQQLELRERAFLAPSTAKEFREAQRAHAASDQNLLEGLVAGAEGTEEAAAYQGVSTSLRALMSTRAGGGAGAAAGGGLGGAAASEEAGGALNADPGQAQAKTAFFQNGGAQLQPGALEQHVRPASSPFEVQMGEVIPCELVSGISSQAPGQIIARVTQDVYDSISHNHLLIPQGTRAVGTYSAQVAQGQTRVQVVWVRLNMPNGDKLDLGGMSGADQQGIAGFEDRVNRHIAQRLATALMVSAFSVGFELTAPRNGSFFGSAVHRGVGESVVQLGTDLARQQSQIPPTLEIRPGYQFNIMVQKDLQFAGPFRGAGRDPSDARRGRR